ncbi:MAG: cysteine synthase A [Myxococcota bacterium]
MRYDHILDGVGATPHVRIRRLFRPDIEVWMKLESANPGGSIKDRIAKAMVERAESEGSLKPGTTIVEPTSGNTGIGLAMVAAVKGYRLVLVMPESMSTERRRLMAAYGANFHLTRREHGMQGAIDRAHRLLKELAPAWMPSQFENSANVDVHVEASASEVVDDFPNGVTALITGVGTGGHITGVGRVLKDRWPKTQVWAVEPERAAVLSGREAQPHRLQGIGPGFFPKILDRTVLDGAITVTEEDAFDMTARLAKTEGILCGISTGASLAAVAKVQHDYPAGSRILTYAYDTGERYLSIEGLFS